MRDPVSSTGLVGAEEMVQRVKGLLCRHGAPCLNLQTHIKLIVVEYVCNPKAPMEIGGRDGRCPQKHEAQLAWFMSQ